MSELLVDRAGRRRSPATMPGFHAGRPPHNKGLRYPADPPKVEEIIAVMRASGDDAHGRRLRGLTVILWRAGLRIQEALALAESDLDQRRGALLVRRGKGGRRREVGMDAWGWEELQPWLELRLELPVGPLLCVINTIGIRRRRELRNRLATARQNANVEPPATEIQSSVQHKTGLLVLVSPITRRSVSPRRPTFIAVQASASGLTPETAPLRREAVAPWRGWGRE
jgi:integrase